MRAAGSWQATPALLRDEAAYQAGSHSFSGSPPGWEEDWEVAQFSLQSQAVQTSQAGVCGSPLFCARMQTWAGLCEAGHFLKALV